MKTYIIGPCSLENYELSYKVLSTIYPYVKDKDFYFKGSFDKANRSSITGKRGPGIEEGMEIFRQLKKDFPGLKVTTDVHETHQVAKIADTVDIIQIPAFLCRQTDLLVESARCSNIVNIKKGQWMNPQNMVDFMKEHFDKVIFDTTHSAQLPKPNGRMGGNPVLAERYYKACDIFNYDGVFVEAHPIPSLSYSDADSVLPLNKMVELLKQEK